MCWCVELWLVGLLQVSETREAVDALEKEVSFCLRGYVPGTTVVPRRLHIPLNNLFDYLRDTLRLTSEGTHTETDGRTDHGRTDRHLLSRHVTDGITNVLLLFCVTEVVLTCCCFLVVCHMLSNLKHYFSTHAKSVCLSVCLCVVKPVVRCFEHGQSNPTYSVVYPDCTLVLRKKPVTYQLYVFIC